LLGGADVAGINPGRTLGHNVNTCPGSNTRFIDACHDGGSGHTHVYANSAYQSCPAAERDGRCP
jgi:hypothetical protein